MSTPVARRVFSQVGMELGVLLVGTVTAPKSPQPMVTQNIQSRYTGLSKSRNTALRRFGRAEGGGDDGNGSPTPLSMDLWCLRMPSDGSVL